MRPLADCRVRLGSLLAAAGVAWMLPGPAPAQGVRDLNWLALQWARGDYRSPVVCEIDGVPRRGFRRIHIDAGPQVHPPVDRIRFYDLEVPAGTRCITATGGPTPNVVGALVIRHRGISRVDTADHDFAAALRRDGGFDFQIVRGRLRAGPSEDPEAARETDLSGGRVRLSQIPRGSDAQRRLAEYPGLRKLRLVVEVPDGSSLEFDLVQRELR